MKMTKDGQLDLNDAATVEAIRNNKVVDTKPNDEDVAAEAAIKAAKASKVTLTFNAAETAQMERMSAIQGKTVKEFLTDQIHQNLLASNVGQPLISGPSAARVRVSGPSKDFGRAS